jgi:hypothetical protein
VAAISGRGWDVARCSASSTTAAAVENRSAPERRRTVMPAASNWLATAPDSTAVTHEGDALDVQLLERRHGGFGHHVPLREEDRKPFRAG